MKLDEGKNQDAIQKLTDFKATVSALNAQGEIAPADAQTLLTRTDEVIACIKGLEGTAAA